MLLRTENPNTFHKPAPSIFDSIMSSSTSLSLEERFEALIKHNEILMKALREGA